MACAVGFYTSRGRDEKDIISRRDIGEEGIYYTSSRWIPRVALLRCNYRKVLIREVLGSINGGVFRIKCQWIFCCFVLSMCTFCVICGKSEVEACKNRASVLEGKWLMLQINVGPHSFPFLDS